MRLLPLLLVALLVPRPAQAAEITIENLWELPVTFFSFSFDDLALLSADYPLRPPDAVDVAITNSAPLAGFDSLLIDVPGFDDGVTYGSLALGGPCPSDCSWFALGDRWAGDVIQNGDSIDVLWSAIGGGDVPIARVTYYASVPEPSTLLLVGIGCAVAARRRKVSP